MIIQELFNTFLNYFSRRKDTVNYLKDIKSEIRTNSLANQINILDLAIDAIIVMRDQSLVIRFFELPKYIRKLIIQNLEERNLKLRDQLGMGVLWPGMSWTYNEEPMTEIEIQIEHYLKSISRSNDTFAIILLNQKDYDNYIDFLREIKENDIQFLDVLNR